MASDKKQSFLHGAALLAGATAIVKVLGALYKIPLGNIIDDAGFGYFNTAYDIYSVLLWISTAGPAGGHEPDDCRGWEPGALRADPEDLPDSSVHFPGPGRGWYRTDDWLLPPLGQLDEFSQFLGSHCGPGSFCPSDVPDFCLPWVLPGAGEHAAYVSEPGAGGRV